MIADLRPALRAYLLADNGIASTVGTRVYPGVLKQGVVEPSIVYNVISELTDRHTKGASGLVAVRMQIDAWARDSDDADALARAIKLRIDGFRGEMPYGDSSPHDVLRVQGVFAETARTDYQADIKMHRMSRDYWVHFEER